MPVRRRLFLLLIALSMILSSCGGLTADPGGNISMSAASPSPSQAVSPEVVRIPFDTRDSLNPYTCQNLQNYHAANLLFDGLVTLDPAYHPELRLAQELTREDSQWVARLRPGLLFSDGTAVTAQDVLYSYQLALQSPRYSASLNGVAQVQTPDEATVVFLLAQPDIYFDRSLSFPILKSGTGTLPLPVGCGRFLPLKNEPNSESSASSGSTQDTGLLQGQSLTLASNPVYYDPVRNIKRVELVDAGDLEAQSYGVMEGTLDLMYSDLQNELNLGLGTGYRQVQLSNLVFLGIGAQNKLLDAPMRVILSSLINRDDINRKTTMGFGSVAYSLIRPSYGGSAAGMAETTPDKLAAALDAAGYGVRDADGYRMAGGKRFSLKLMVNSENKSRTAAAGLIKNSLERAGIHVEVETVPYDDYLARVARGECDLYLGEMKIPYNLELQNFFSPGGNPEILGLYARVKSGEAPAIQLDSLLREEMPVIPILYRRGFLCFSRDFSANIVASERDIFYNIGAW